jgi:WD40 repeat protein
MAEPFNRLLVRPSDDALSGALVEATEAGGLRHRGLSSWVKLLAEVRRRREGRQQVEDPRSGGCGYASLAWWTDRQGVKHYRVAGGDTRGPGPHRHYSRSPDDPRPPLWHVYPDHVYQRLRAGKAEWLASCPDCGTTGLPGALAWMGPCCGPCHDRREEGSLPAERARPATLEFGPGAVGALAFAPDGRGLAVSCPGPRVCYRDLAEGRTRDLYLETQIEGGEIPSLSFYPDGRTVAAANPNADGVCLLDVERGGEREHLGSEWAAYAGSEVRQVSVSPSGRSLAILAEGAGVEVWHRDPDGHWGGSVERGATALGYRPDGELLAVAGPGPRLRLLNEEGEDRGDFPVPVPDDHEIVFLDFTPDGRALVVLSATSLAALARREGQVLVWDLEGRREVPGTRAAVPFVSCLTLSPDGRRLAWVVHDEKHSPGAVTFWDLQRAEEVGVLEWDGEDLLRELAFTPDGSHLATGSAAGTVKLWPWALLLEA